MAGRINKQDPIMCCPQKIHLSSEDTHRFQVKVLKMIFQVNGSEKATGIAILVSDKGIKPRRITRDI